MRPAGAPRHEVRMCCPIRFRSFIFLVALEVALDRRRSQKFLDPFRFVESFVNAEANFRSKF
jgi:hypothetical protein